MQYLVAGYFLGILVGRNCFLDSFRQLSYPSILAGLIVTAFLTSICKSPKQKSFALVLWLSIGAFWGLYSSAPIPVKGIAGAVIRTNVSQEGTPALIKSNTGKVFEVSSTNADSGSGKVTVWHRPGLFSSRRASIQINHSVNFFPPSRWNDFALEVRTSFSEQTAAYGHRMSAWLRSAILGIPDDLGPEISHAFRRTGLLHIVVVSGSHITMVAMGALALFGTPFRIAYALRWISPLKWVAVSIFIKVAVIGVVLFFCTLVGASHASQRSVLGFAVLHFSRILFGDWSVGRRLNLTAIVQIAVFPIGFLCESTIMSWLAYLLVVEHANLSKTGRRLFKNFRLQIVLSILMGAICGQWSILGVFANLVIIPIVPVVFGFGLLLLVPSVVPEWILSIALGIQDKFLIFICWISDLTDGWPFMVVHFNSADYLFRFFLLLLGVVFVLNSATRLSIQKREHEVDTNDSLENHNEYEWVRNSWKSKVTSGI